MTQIYQDNLLLEVTAGRRSGVDSCFGLFFGFFLNNFPVFDSAYADPYFFCDLCETIPITNFLREVLKFEGASTTFTWSSFDPDVMEIKIRSFRTHESSQEKKFDVEILANGNYFSGPEELGDFIRCIRFETIDYQKMHAFVTQLVAELESHLHQNPQLAEHLKIQLKDSLQT